MRKRFTRFAVIALALAAVAQSATAGQYVYDAGTAQASYVVARVFDSKLLRTGTATVLLVKFQGANATGPAHVLPAPADHKTPGVESDYFGCVDVRIEGRRDGGCDLKRPITLDFDPLMSEGRISYSVKSTAVDGYRVDVNLVLKGLGTAPGPAPACSASGPAFCDSLTQNVDAGPHKLATGGATAPAWMNGFSLQAARLLTRPVSVTGSIRGSYIGGGPVQSTSIAQVYYGAGATLGYTSDCILKVGTCRT